MIHPHPRMELTVGDETIPIESIEYDIDRNLEGEQLWSFGSEMAYTVRQSPAIEFTMTFEGESAESFMQFMRSATEPPDPTPEHGNESHDHDAQDIDISTESPPVPQDGEGALVNIVTGEFVVAGDVEPASTGFGPLPDAIVEELESVDVDEDDVTFDGFGD